MFERVHVFSFDFGDVTVRYRVLSAAAAQDQVSSESREDRALEIVCTQVDSWSANGGDLRIDSCGSWPDSVDARIAWLDAWPADLQLAVLQALYVRILGRGPRPTLEKN
jgi:hypothetical protein